MHATINVENCKASASPGLLAPLPFLCVRVVARSVTDNGLYPPLD